MSVSNKRTPLDCVISHVFLPPKLPSGDETVAFTTCLSSLVISSLEEFALFFDGDDATALARAKKAIEAFFAIITYDNLISEACLQKYLGQVVKCDITIPLFFEAQNAGAIVRKEDEQVIFETFELLPDNASAMAPKGRLKRYFPDNAVAVPCQRAGDLGFQNAIAKMISKLSQQSAKEMRAHAKKGGQEHIEERDTTDPALVTQLLSSILLSNGTFTPVQGIWKNTRDEVRWSNGNKLAWHRSPIWLLLRVTLHLMLSRHSKDDGLYKRFMAFFVSKALQEALCHETDSDILYVMQAKLAQRLRKLDGYFYGTDAWLPAVRNTLSKATEVLGKRWDMVIKNDARDLNLAPFLPFDVEQDLSISLPKLDSFISSIAQRSELQHANSIILSSNIFQSQKSVLPVVSGISSGDKYAYHNLAVVEDWVAMSLDQWLNENLKGSDTCDKLGNLIKIYHGVAKGLYQNNPEGSSIMFLTILELWIACDKSATMIHPLINEYHSQIPSRIWGSLLLNSSADMKRLVRAEGYLSYRRHKATCRSSILNSFGEAMSFSVRYFSSSVPLQNLKREIEAKAQQQRDARVSEFNELKHEYDDLLAEAARSSCTSYTDEDGEIIHDVNCFYGSIKRTKCYLTATAKSLEISVHEWPLPSNILQAQSTVFELGVPASFSYWRDTTIYVLKDVFEPVPTSPLKLPAEYRLGSVEGLCGFSQATTISRRVTLLSTTKPNTITHRSKLKVMHATTDDVCVNNGLQWQYFDEYWRNFICNPTGQDYIWEACTFQLPANSKGLQVYLNRPSELPGGEDPNCVIARQDACPYHLSIDEFKAICDLPLGNRVQWMNILRQLAMPSLDWKTSEAVLFAWQVAEQCGPSSGSWRRLSHEVVSDGNFIASFIFSLSKTLNRIKENWESCRAVGIFTILITRLLSLVTAEYSGLCTSSLSTCRDISSGWLKKLRDKAASTLDDKQRREFSERALENALVCAASFDVEEHHLTKLLRDPDNVAVFFDSAFTIQENLLNGQTNESIQRALLLKWNRLTFRSRRTLIEEIITKRNLGLDKAVISHWQAFNRITGENWVLEADCWLGTKAASIDGKSSLAVHINLVTAELLVNGLPVSRLPAEYEQHPTYLLFFGRCSVDAVPSPEPGMAFSANRVFEGQQIHLTLTSTNSIQKDLLMRACKDGHAWEFVPSRLLDPILPAIFVQNYVHWYDITKEILEFRPLGQPWSSEASVWRMRRVGSSWRAQDTHGVCLIDLHTDTANRLFEVFRSLEDLRGLQLFYDPLSAAVTVEIPRLNLQFSISVGSATIFSRQLRGMCVDKHQGIGTLIGLKNKLVLRRVTNPSVRVVLVPEAQPQWVQESYSSSARHVNISIDRDAERWQAYNLTKHLQCLAGNDSLQSKLFLAQLHALTSSCLPDPFTGLTGTEEALNILRSTGVRSFDCLSSDNIKTLRSIARLAPRREWYPLHVRQMQDVTWDKNLSFLSQHGLFPCAVKAIFDQASQTGFLFENFQSFEPLTMNNSHLMEREAVRASTFQGDGFGAQDFTDRFDVQYDRRGSIKYSVRARKAHMASSTVGEDCRALPYKPSASFITDIYQLLILERTAGPSSIGRSEFQYDSKWLENPSKIMNDLWCRIHYTLSSGSETFSKFDLMCWVGTMAFAKDCHDSALLAMMGFATIVPLTKVAVPKASSFLLNEGAISSRAKIHGNVYDETIPLYRCPQAALVRETFESAKQAKARRNRTWEKVQGKLVATFTDNLHDQWRCKVPVEPQGLDFRTYIDCDAAMKVIRQNFKIWHENFEFGEYLKGVHNILDDYPVKPVLFPHTASHQLGHQLGKTIRSVTFRDLLNEKEPLNFPEHIPDCHILSPTEAKQSSSSHLLANLLDKLDSRGTSKQEVRYLSQLKQSVSCLNGQAGQHRVSVSDKDVKHILEKRHYAAKEHFDCLHEMLVCELGRRQQKCWPLVSISYQWPRICTRTLLSQLNRHNWKHLSDPWKQCFIAYACSLSILQGAERLLQLRDQKTDLVKEIISQGPRTWSCLECPESLLLEIEGNLRIREVQEEVAKTMRHPPKDENSVMQLNMGEGKSSVIVPIVAASLANGSQLVRVIVAKPQSRQMFEMLVARFGALIGRRVYHLPFSRSTKLGVYEARIIEHICHECMSSGGILLVQPEHLLSFQLMSIETSMNSDESIAKILLGTYKFLNEVSRDVVDESDENFSTKFELIYTMGKQRPIEHAPDRWVILQDIMELVARFSLKVKERFHKLVEVEVSGSGRFPQIRFLDEKAGKDILGMIANHLCQNGLNGFPIAHQSQETRRILLRYIVEPQPSPDVIEAVEEGTFWTEATCSTLLLIRGLFAGGLLAFIFGQRRWRVNFGLDPSRRPSTRLAVPYRSKDNPSLRSEFSHPDVVICLTCLAYYYKGLTDEKLFMALRHLFKSDQAGVEYAAWVESAPELPLSFQHLEGINIRDAEQCVNMVFPQLKFSKQAIDYYLSHIVFIKEMKEFPHKLSASGWDISRVKGHPTTGFSGTNDCQHMLPLTMKQLDLDSQRHTNALVLDHLLQPENSVALLTELGQAGVCNGKELLQLVAQMEPETRVILDVGAQIIDLTNEQVARTWLSLIKDQDRVQAVVFCNAKDEITVMDRNGRTEQLQTSPFAKQLDVCLVFLDEAHTRGIDLKLPQKYRAAVSLGANLTKDRLVQACMRMRKLGEGQSVVFLVTEEIETKLRALKENTGCNKITVSHILEWTILETWADIRRSMPLWATQGRSFVNQEELWARAKSSNGELIMDEKLANRFLSDEAQSLAQRYLPSRCTEVGEHGTSTNSTLNQIAQRCEEFENLDMTARTLQEEQERELAPEIEQERQVERPPPEVPAPHTLDPAISQFIKTGMLDEKDPSFLWAFQAFENTSASNHLNINEIPHGLRVTRDFVRTIAGRKSVLEGKGSADSYQRMVQWVLANNRPGQDNIHLVVLSPYEANGFMEEIRASNAVALHMYAPRQNKGFAPIDDLQLYVVPSGVSTLSIRRRLLIELNLFAGQTYFSSYDEYKEVCNYLGLAWRAGDDGMVVQADGFIKRGSKTGDHGGFEESPVQFLKVMTKIRRNCESIEKTHLGKVLEGTLLTVQDF